MAQAVIEGRSSSKEGDGMSPEENPYVLGLDESERLREHALGDGREKSAFLFGNTSTIGPS